MKATPLKRLAFLAVSIPLAFIVALTSLLPASPAAAQERPRTVLEMLFGNGSRQAAPQRRQAEPPRRVIRRKKAAEPRRARKRATSRSAKAPKRSAPRRREAARPAPPPPPPVVTKNEDASKVLVVGDFLAASLANGLETMTAENDMVEIVAETDGSSGLVRDDHFDWLGKLGPMIDETDPAVVVVMLGSNDRQPISGPAGALSLRSPEWTQEYERRVAALADITKNKGVPLVWVGMPSFKFDRMSEDMVFLNDLYRKNAANVSGEFVDVWDGFVDANGAFSYSGPDVAGQPAQLRASDGITMTPAGEDKLAFFAERPVFRFLGSAAVAGTPTPVLGPEQLSNLQLPPLANATNATSAAPVALSDPSLDGGESLLGAGGNQTFSLEPSPRERLVLSGSQTRGIEGRADNFAWNTKSSAVGPVTAEAPIAFRGSVDLETVRSSGGIEPPAEMPSLADAILEEWAEDSQAAQTVPGAQAAAPTQEDSGDAPAQAEGVTAQ